MVLLLKLLHGRMEIWSIPWSFLSSMVALYLQKSTTEPLLLIAAWKCYISWRYRYRAVGHILNASLKSWTHRWISQSKSFYSYYFGRCKSDLVPFSYGRSTCYSNKLKNFLITIPTWFHHVNSLLPRATRLFACRMLFFDL